MAIETFENLPIVDTGGRSLISALDAKKISFPNDGADFGNSGDQLRSLGNGGVEWAAPGMPTYEQTEQALSNWLDEHPEAVTTVEDGAITDAKLNDALKRGLVYGFETVTDTNTGMKYANNLVAGMICHTNGFHVSGDGGAAWYEITDSGTANEKDVIACGQLFAKLIVNGAVRPEQLGADGAGVNDASGVFDYIVKKYENIELFGTYFIQENVEIDTIPIRMFSNNRSKILFDYASFVQTIEFCRYENIFFDSHSGNTDSELVLFDIKTPNANNDTWFNFCWFGHAGICINNTGVNLHLENCNSVDCGTVIKNNYDSAIGNQNRAIVMKNCKVQGADLIADFDANFPNDKARAANHFASNHFDYCGKIINGNVPNLLFVDNYVYTSDQVPFMTLDCNNFNFSNVTCRISNNTFVNGATAFNDFLFTFDNTNNITFEGNYIRAAALNLVQTLTNASGLVISDNVIWNNANAVIDTAAGIGTIFTNNYFRNIASATLRGQIYSIEGNTNVNYSSLYLIDSENKTIAKNLEIGQTITPNIGMYKPHVYIVKLTVTLENATTYTDHAFLIPFGTTSIHTIANSARNNTVNGQMTFGFSGNNATLTVNAFTYTGTNVASFTIDELIAV